jgi:flavin-dependent dehydrogenase
MFLNDICPEKNIQRGGFDGDCSKYDLVVDATGEKRAVLSPIRNDMKITCRQGLFNSPIEDLDITILPSRSIGYCWIFPLKPPFVHIGQGAMSWDFPPPEIRAAMGIAGVAGKDPICGWHTSQIRLMSPIHSRPNIYGNVVGVGESCGAVSPNNGAGILPGILSARLLADHILDSSSSLYDGHPEYWMRLYEMDLIKEFSFLDRETEIVRKLVDGRRVGLRDLICLYKNAKHFGIYPGPKQIIDHLKMVGARFL